MKSARHKKLPALAHKPERGYLFQKKI